MGAAYCCVAPMRSSAGVVAHSRSACAFVVIRLAEPLRRVYGILGMGICSGDEPALQQR